MIRFFLPDEHPDEDDDELLPHCGLALAVIKNLEFLKNWNDICSDLS